MAVQPGRRVPALGSRAARAARGRRAALQGVAAALLLVPRGGSRPSRRGRGPPRCVVPRPGHRCLTAAPCSRGLGPRPPLRVALVPPSRVAPAPPSRPSSRGGHACGSAPEGPRPRCKSCPVLLWLGHRAPRRLG
ncbi:hypothetical protein Zm00014a_031504 [Zea mays]|uniref:Uncharacterized protein n=1 Tax=Zea mays TaxID=4577 RepID=A0A317YJ94_MAIZE|nr:hypothetical protein Zm00014a_031504 [Zea mays]